MASNGSSFPNDLMAQEDHKPMFPGAEDLGWHSTTRTSAPFGAEEFVAVMENLIRNPNITTSYVFRAEIWYDSLTDATATTEAFVQPLAAAATIPQPNEPGHSVVVNGLPQQLTGSKLLPYLRKDAQPMKAKVPAGWRWERSWVRNMIPRNPKRDMPMVQTCTLLTSANNSANPRNDVHAHSEQTLGSVDEGAINGSVSLECTGHNEIESACIPSGQHDKADQYTLLLMLPHAERLEDIPFYHPKVAGIAFLYSWSPATQEGEIAIHYQTFPALSPPLSGDEDNSATDLGPSSRLYRTALHLLGIIRKHGIGFLTGYAKRVNHDLIVPQKRFQDTYTDLKSRYARSLIEGWVEETPAEKHVFEDLGIGAFLIEVWKDRYAFTKDERLKTQKPDFPGFVDIGCGNGLLVNLLNQEGYNGTGFDVRKRKSWTTYSSNVQARLYEQILVPKILLDALEENRSTTIDNPPSTKSDPDNLFHHGLFPPSTFLISNHADELTVWTPLLAYLSNSPFIVIPCCSHDFAGARTRFGKRAGPSTETNGEKFQCTESTSPSSPTHGEAPDQTNSPVAAAIPDSTTPIDPVTKPKPTPPQTPPKPPSAYAALTAYVASLAQTLNYTLEKEILRIPSTRNVALLGFPAESGPLKAGEVARRMGVVRGVVEGEMGVPLERVAEGWVERAGRIRGSKGNCH